LEKIYRRFYHIGDVIVIFKEYLRKNGTKTFPEDEKLQTVLKFFANAKDGVARILCEIQSIFAEIKVYERVTADTENKPSTALKKISDSPKIDLWVIYREYETLVDYSFQLLSVLLDENEK
jgi:hypothetical protein